MLREELQAGQKIVRTVGLGPDAHETRRQIDLPEALIRKARFGPHRRKGRGVEFRPHLSASHRAGRGMRGFELLFGE